MVFLNRLPVLGNPLPLHALRPQVAPGGVADHGIKPGFQARGAIVAGFTFQKRQIGLLHHVLGCLSVIGHERQRPAERALVQRGEHLPGDPGIVFESIVEHGVAAKLTP